ncbi:MAG: stage II sporulation protein M [Bacteroidia bacterium]
MKESRFVEQNNQKWAELEHDIKGDSGNPEKKSRLFIQISDDLSYARTFYRNRSVREYLNGVGQLLFSQLNLNERFGFQKFIAFFTDTFPKAMYANKRAMLVSFIVFALSFCVGVFTSMQDPEFAKEILGSGYIKVTEENIAAGDPMAIYKDSGEFEMFVRIAFNNLRVAFITFLFGVLSSIGTLVVLIYNGVMVGVFQYFFIERDLFWTSFLTIWTHGTIEIACIIVAGGAGLQLGKGLLFPGTYSRIEAFKMSGKSALVIIAGITPLIIAAAFIEGYQTRHTEINDYIKLGFILFCLAFVLFYFFWYPKTKYKNGKETFSEFEEEPFPSSTAIFNTKEIYGTGKLFSFSLGYCVLFTKQTLTLLFSVALAFSLIVSLFPAGTFIDPIIAEYAGFYLGQMFDFENYGSMAIPVIFGVWAILFSTSMHFKRLYCNKVDLKRYVSLLLASLVVALIIVLFTSISTWWSSIITFILSPLIIIALCISNLENKNMLTGPKLVFSYLRNNWGKFLAVNFLFGILIWTFYIVSIQLVDPIVAPFIATLVTDNIETQQLVYLGTKVFFVSLVPFAQVFFIAVSSHYMYFTFKESNTAENLFERIKKLVAE